MPVIPRWYAEGKARAALVPGAVEAEAGQEPGDATVAVPAALVLRLVVPVAQRPGVPAGRNPDAAVDTAIAGLPQAVLELSNRARNSCNTRRDLR